MANQAEPVIVSLDAFSVLDSRGAPTIRVTTQLSDGSSGVATAPSGKSTGRSEKAELRDGGPPFFGLGIEGAAAGVRGPIAERLAGLPTSDPASIDRVLIALDGTNGRTRLGANAMVAVSMSVWRAAAQARDEPLWRLLAQGDVVDTPIPLFNVVNGGAHAPGGLRLQEFMLVPHGFSSANERVRCGAEIYAALRMCFADALLSTAVGDEGGFVFTGGRVAEANAMLCSAVERAGYKIGSQVSLAIDAAANGFRNPDGTYSPEPGLTLTTEQMCMWWRELVDAAPLVMLEDPLAEEDLDGWQLLTKLLGERVTIVGDDIFVTDAERIRFAACNGIANAALLKPNQIGTVGETIDAWRAAREAGYSTVVSHRSGETVDTFISDLAVGLGSEYLKAGAPARGERVEKYNRLLEIERELQSFHA